MATPEPAASIAVTLVYSPCAGQVDETALTLPVGSTVGAALQASGLVQRWPDMDLSAAAVGVWGRLQALDHVLRDGDRVEAYRPLQVDPKEARRKRQRARA